MPQQHPSKSCRDEIKQFCGRSLLGDSKECVTCVKRHIGAIDGGLNSMCKTSELEHLCGVDAVVVARGESG